MGSNDFDVIYELWYLEESEIADEYAILLGIFSSHNAAQLALHNVRYLDKFLKYPDGFEIAKRKLDRPGWTDGFCSPFACDEEK